MSRPLQLLLGPELLWLFFYLLVAGLIKVTGAPAKNLDSLWLGLPWLVPLLGIPLTFVLWYVPGVEHDWLLLRAWIAGLLGAHYVLEKGLGAHSEQGPGVGTAYIMGLIFVLLMLVAGSVFVKIRF